jgi:hypothetical protein
MRSPALIYALLDDEQRATLNRGHAARRAAREAARAERGARPRVARSFRYGPEARAERGCTPCLP